MGGPTGAIGGAIGGAIVFHQAQPVLGQEEHKFVYASKEARQRANVLYLLCGELRLDLRLIIVFFWWRIQLEPFGAFSSQLELETPHVLLGIIDVTVLSEE